MRKTNTKEEILNAAFSVLAESGCSGISLADVAQRAGITKPAIFRHFKDKETLLEAMNELFLDEAAAFLKAIDITQKDHAALYSAIISYFAQHREIPSYFMFIAISSNDFEKTFIEGLQKRGAVYPGREIKSKEKSTTEYIACICWFVTAVFFILDPAGIEAAEKDNKQFSAHLADLMYNGWNKLHPITSERRAELAAIADLSAVPFPEESKLFVSLAAVIDEYGLPGATVGRIAEEMGMAKSSLYTYFSGKNAMISNLIGDEIRSIIAVITERSAQLNDFSEKVYVHMQTIVSYMLKRKTLLPVCNWLRRRGNVLDASFFSSIEEIFPAIQTQKTDLNGWGTFSTFLFMSWHFAVVISILVQYKHTSCDTAFLSKAVDCAYCCLSEGMK